jgi:hypothetical protein
VRKRDARQHDARREETTTQVEIEVQEAEDEEEEAPVLVDDDEEEWEDDDDNDNATAHMTRIDDQWKSFVALVESLLPRHGPFCDTRGPTMGADRQRRIEALARAAMITRSTIYGVLHAKEWGQAWKFNPKLVAEDEAFLKKHGYLSVAA